MKKTSEWSKAVRKALIDKGMTLKQLAEIIGYSYCTVNQLINGRYSNRSCQIIAEKINEQLGTEGLPERINTPSDEWCQCVKIGLIRKKMSITDLAKNLNVSRDQLSLIINGKMMNEEIVQAIAELLKITLPAVPSDDN